MFDKFFKKESPFAGLAGLGGGFYLNLEASAGHLLHLALRALHHFHKVVSQTSFSLRLAH